MDAPVQSRPHLISEVALHESIDRIVAALSHASCQITDDQRPCVCLDVYDYLRRSSQSEVATSIKASMTPLTLAVFNGAMNSTRFDEALFTANSTQTSDQGVYGGIVRTATACSVYIGSARGKRGLRNRINFGHLSERSRRIQPQKALYLAMDFPGAITDFVCLIGFRSVVPPGLVLFAEAVCCCLFATYDNEMYHNSRPHELPILSWGEYLNRSDPLKDYCHPNLNLGECVTTYKRTRLLEKCLQGLPFRVYRYKAGSDAKGLVRYCYRFSAGRVDFSIPLKIAESWNLSHTNFILVRWDALDMSHEHPWPFDAGEHDDAKGVGIQISTRIDGEEHSYWLTRKGAIAIRIANTFYDFLRRRIVGRDYEWKSREPQYSECRPRTKTALQPARTKIAFQPRRD